MSQNSAQSPGRLAIVGRVAGPVLFLAILALPSGSMGPAGLRVAAAIAWMAVWWVTEAAPLAVTSLLPLVLFPLMAVRGISDVAPNYAEHMVFLFFGGFVLALAVERSGLHRRLALSILHLVGSSPRRLVWGFLLSTAVLSMWLSNTATTLMMLPIASGVVDRTPGGRPAMRIFLAVAFGASIGGLGTLIGTPPNLVLAGMAPRLVSGLPALTFGGWMLFGVPMVLLLLPVAGLLLARGLSSDESGAHDALEAERVALGPMSTAERRSAVLFALTALAWITRAGMDFGSFSIPGWSHLLPNPRLVSDAVPAIAAACIAAILPAGGGTKRALVTWEEIRHGVPWGVLLLFGGGFALADGVRAAALDTWLAGRLHGLSVLPLPALVLVVALIAMGATELTSNTATATLLVPVLAALAEALGEPAYLLMVPATVACSCAFMLPVATPPNAIVIGSGHVSATDLFREGIRLNLASAVIITVLTLTLGRLVLPV
jgi:solute carrier family 13 (sodium-dependent dicarboxylate transporter), member 2/3/5